MDDEAPPMRLPDSVYRYAADARVRTAVDLLLAGKAPKMPDGLQWDEVEDFYGACLAAQQTKVEWAVTMNAIWNAVFPDLVDGWRRSSIDQQLEDSGIKLDVDQLWKEDQFTRDLTRGGHYLEAQIEMDPDEGVRANVSLWLDGRSVELPVSGATHLDEGWLCSPWLAFDTQEIDLTPLRSAAGAAVDAANRLVPD